MNRRKYISVIILIASALVILSGVFSPAYSQSVPIPSIRIAIGESEEPGDLSVTLKILFLITILSVAPTILIMLTSFTRMVVVFSFLRHAMGTQQMPPNQVMVSLALFLTFFIMTPVWQEINDNALKPFLAKEISYETALDRAAEPLKKFMLRQTRDKDLSLLMKVSKIKKPTRASDVPLTTLIPSFVISELRIAFQIGFLIYVPFLILDMVVACVLLSMGMMMLPPIMISLPFKLLLFVLVDGWYLIVGSLVRSFV
ncbi:MAG: flagellar type III secretion system pore protein FliP [Deltaproteobacteria bacterium]|nr:flagellar type III secretion system pore protein FliP [Deltaproteobacteria bacterium]